MIEVKISDKQNELRIWIDKIGLKQKHFAELFTLDEFKDTSYVKPKFHFKNKLSKTFIQNMKDITKDT